MKTAVFSARPYDRRFLDEANQALPTPFTLVYFEAALCADTARLAQGCQAVCVFVNDHLDAPTLEALAELGIGTVLLRCAGFNNVDLAVAARLGFVVARVPAYSPEAVAEHTLALVMTLTRQTHRAYNRVREGNFMLEGLLGSTLHGKTVGIVGLGRIGLATARIFHGMGCVVLGCDPYPSSGFDRLGRRVASDELLTCSDIVSLHCPLTEASHHMIDAAALARMKTGAMLVNTSRGALIDTGAVIQALKSRQLGHLAVDVYEQESTLFFQDRSGEIIDDEIFQRLMTFPNVLLTGHQGFFTVEALREISATTLAIFDTLSNERPARTWFLRRKPGPSLGCRQTQHAQRLSPTHSDEIGFFNYARRGADSASAPTGYATAFAHFGTTEHRASAAP